MFELGQPVRCDGTLLGAAGGEGGDNALFLPGHGVESTLRKRAFFFVAGQRYIPQQPDIACGHGREGAKHFENRASAGVRLETVRILIVPGFLDQFRVLGEIGPDRLCREAQQLGTMPGIFNQHQVAEILFVAACGHHRDGQVPKGRRRRMCGEIAHRQGLSMMIPGVVVILPNQARQTDHVEQRDFRVGGELEPWIDYPTSEAGERGAIGGITTLEITDRAFEVVVRGRRLRCRMRVMGHGADSRVDGLAESGDGLGAGRGRKGAFARELRKWGERRGLFGRLRGGCGLAGKQFLDEWFDRLGTGGFEKAAKERFGFTAFQLPDPVDGQTAGFGGAGLGFFTQGGERLWAELRHEPVGSLLKGLGGTPSEGHNLRGEGSNIGRRFLEYFENQGAPGDVGFFQRGTHRVGMRRDLSGHRRVGGYQGEHRGKAAGGGIHR